MTDIARLTARRTTRDRFDLGECPVWDDARGRWLFADLPSGNIFSVSAHSDRTRLIASAGAQLGCFVPLAAHVFLVARDRSVLIVGAEGSRRVADLAAAFTGEVRFNDGKISPDGSLWVGVAALDGQDSGGLVRCRPDGQIDVLLEGLQMPNGMGWSESGERFWLADSLAGVVTEYRWTGDQLHRVRDLVSLAAEEGMPDGFCLDISGALWIAVWGSSQVRRYAQDGELLASVGGLPPCPTSCAFGGPDNSTMLITTASDAAEPDDRSGAVFACRPNIGGQPASRPVGYRDINSRSAGSARQ